MAKSPASSQDQLMFSFEEPASDPLEGRVVCMMGSFTQGARTIQNFFQQLGAEVRSGKPNRNTQYVLIGENPLPQNVEYLQTMAFHGFCPRVLSQTEVNALLEGADIQNYIVPKDIKKNLKLTYRHYELSRVDFTTRMNPLYTRELYVATDTQMPYEQLYQLLGNHGVYANNYIDDTTDTLLLSDASIDHLRMGSTDATIQYIEKMYNNSRSQYFRFSILSEGEAIAAFLRQ